MSASCRAYTSCMYPDKSWFFSKLNRKVTNKPFPQELSQEEDSVRLHALTYPVTWMTKCMIGQQHASNHFDTGLQINLNGLEIAETAKHENQKAYVNIPRGLSSTVITAELI